MDGYAALLAAAGFERFMLDRLCLDGEAPLRCQVAHSGCSNRTHSAMVCGAVFRAMDACRLQPYSVIGC